MYITLSPAYAIRNEANGSFLIRVDKIINLRNSEFGTYGIPPFIGYILSHIGDFEYGEAVKKISEALCVSTVSIERFVEQLIENPECKEFKYSDELSVVFPSMLLQRCLEKPNPNIHEEQCFNPLSEYVIRRPTVPVNANLMVTTKCNTDCRYCYANRTLQPLLDTSKILDIIRELHDQGTINVTLTGGDIFAHPDWRIILKQMRQYGYKPFLSTKTPLTLEQTKFLIELGYEEIQFSLDSQDPEILKTLINVKDGYLERVTSFFNYCSELNLNVLVRSVLTKINASRACISSLYDYLVRFDCVKEWVMTPAFFSKYKESYYKSLEVDNDDLIWVYEFKQREGLAFKVRLNKVSDEGYVLKRFDTVEEYVCHNQICLANTIGISILANGDCSVCEMLYDNPEYLLGNVRESSIRDIWNSEKALALYSMAQDRFPESSPCRECKVFDKCRNGFGKRVCYMDIVKTGHAKWYPDPRCPNAENVDIIL
jgi:radical SAM additional 4Fe4S-binding domain